MSQAAVPHASALVTLGLPAVALGVLALAAGAVRAAAPGKLGRFALGAGLWVVLWSGLALAGVLARDGQRPPPLAVLLVATVAVGVALGLSPLGAAVGRALPLWTLVGFHAFRLPLELVMHQAAREGVMPPEMTFGGLNYDIVTGIAAIVVAWALRRGVGPRLGVLFTVVSGLLLATVLVVAVAASPLFRAFGPPPHINSWVASFPFVLLPAVCVVAAIAGQVVLVRRLLAPARLDARLPAVI